jgi:pimeloyl-ACP methyl ester carboxylesterase
MHRLHNLFAPMNNQTNRTSASAVIDNSTVISIAPVTLAAPSRGADLQLRISAPVGGKALPVIVFSHGNNQSLHAYGPLTDYWAAHGFVVIQPAHLDSWALDLAEDDSRRPHFWRYREDDLVRVLDDLRRIEQGVPAIQDRLDHNRIAVAGHSWGATTASMLLGATHPDPDNGRVVDIADARVKAGILLCVAGTGGDNLSPFAAARFPFMNPDFSGMRTPTLVVAGDKDQSPFSIRGPEWRREAYDLSPSPKALLTVFGGEHWLGGIHSYEFNTGDANRARVATIQRLSTAYLSHALNATDPAWSKVALAESKCGAAPGEIEEK